MTSHGEHTGRTDEFRARLVGDLRPVRSYWSVRARFALWLSLQAMVVVAVVSMGARADLGEQMARWPFVVEVAALAAVGVASAYLALRSAVPGRAPDRAFAYALAAGAAVTFGLGVAVLPWGAFDSALSGGRVCAGKTLMIAAVPWIAVAGAVARGAALDPRAAGLLAGLGPLASAAAIMRLMCPIEEGMHVLLWHDLPVVAGAVLSLAAGAALFNGWARRPLARG